MATPNIPKTNPVVIKYAELRIFIRQEQFITIA